MLRSLVGSEMCIRDRPINDKKSRDILLEIKKDETKHKQTAKELGSTNLSSQTKNFMSFSSRVMKKLSFYF